MSRAYFATLERRLRSLEIAPAHGRSCATAVRPAQCRLVAAGLIALSLCMPMVASGAGTAHARPGQSTASVPPDLHWARLLVAEVTPRNNAYATDPTIVRWAGVGGAQRAVNRSVCSTFVDQVMEQAYGYPAASVTSWLGLYAQTIHHAIVQGRGFISIATVGSIEPGDIIAIEYYDDDRPSTGHAMIVDEAPQPIRAIPPLIPGTQQYSVAVIDSALSGHGPLDTRAEAHGRWHSGVGRGIFRLYSDAHGHIAGYSWSATAGSRYYPPRIRNLRVGRLTSRW
jgi:hypothetical protein